MAVRTRTIRALEQLGMPAGTAMNRLKKMIMFDLVRKTNQDICFKCNKKIETVEELSVEHKIPWENRNAELFWDLDNIAFSHLRCNRPHSVGAEKLRIVGADGELWCNGCKKFVPENNVSNAANRWNGKHDRCKTCIQKYMKERRKRIKETKYAQLV